MKCQKCGRNDVNFHYSSNINGCVTEEHLCSDCAAESGYDMEQMFSLGQMFDIGSIFDPVFPVAVLPVAMQPLMGAGIRAKRRQTDTCGCGYGKTASINANVEVDEKMKTQRELNMQMRIAVNNEEFEKAAELRDKIKELEAQ